MYRHLLVPLDGSELSTSLVTHATEFARAVGARITFFSMREDYAASSEGALLHAMSPNDFAEAAAGDANAILAKAIAAARAVEVECEGVVRTGGHPYEEILIVARERGCDLIHMASHGRRGLKALLPGSQTQKVLAHATVPVLVDVVEVNCASVASEVAVSIIKDEHRAMAAVTSGLRQFASRMRAGRSVDLAFLASMLQYMNDFPDTLHHPKEERFLFDRLAQRSDESHGLIEVLVAEHREGAELLAQLRARVATFSESGACRDAEGLPDLIDRFADGQWRHLVTEEKLILPAAQRHLTEADWGEIEEAFRSNRELCRGSEIDQAYRRFFARLMNLASGQGVQ